MTTDSPPLDDRTPRWIVPVALVAAWTSFFAPVLFGGKVFYFRDLFFFHRPLREVVVRAVAHGWVPYLNVGLNLGQPMLADPSYSVFYPANLLYLVLPFNAAWNLVLAGHVLWAAAGTFLLARGLGAARLPALAAGLVFAFSGPLVSSLNAYSLLLAMSWTPWVLAGALAAWRDGGRAVPLTGLALAAQTLACEPTVSSCTAGMLAIGWLGGMFVSDRRRAHAWRGMAIATIAILIASAQLLPTLAWLPQTDRGGRLPFRESAAWWSLDPERLPELLAPQVNGNALDESSASFWSGHLSDAGYPYVPRLYLGWLPLLVAPFAWRSKWGKAALGLAAAGLMLSLGHHLPGYVWIYRAVPILWITRYPEKFTIFAALGFALALAIGVSRVRDASKGAIAITAIVLLAMTGALTLGGTGVPPQGITALQEALRSSAIAQALGWGALAGVLGLMLVWPRTRTAAVILVPCIAFIDVALATRDVPKSRALAVDGREPRLLSAAPGLRDLALVPLTELQSDRFFHGVVNPYEAMQEALFPYTGLRWGARYAVADDIARTMSAAGARRRAMVFETMRGRSLDTARAIGAGAIVSLDGVTIPTLVRGPRSRSGDLEVAADFLSPAPSPTAWITAGDGQVAATERAPHEVELKVDAASSVEIAVQRDSIPGWRATLDDAPAIVERDPLGLLRIKAPPGSHTIQLTYTPPGLGIGFVLSLSGSAFALALLLRQSVRRRRAGW